MIIKDILLNNGYTASCWVIHETNVHIDHIENDISVTVILYPYKDRAFYESGGEKMNEPKRIKIPYNGNGLNLVGDPTVVMENLVILVVPEFSDAIIV